MTVSAPGEDCAAIDRVPIPNGVLVAVVGPSGAGKDSILGYARERLSGNDAVEFVRRVITRPSDAASEDHDTLSDCDFAAAEKDGAFAVSWSAHGLRYGLPAVLDRSIEAGRVAVANVSRTAIPQIKARYANFVVVEVTASVAVLAQRLSARGRESQESVVARLSRRTVIEMACTTDVVRIDNGGPLEVAGEQFVTVLREATSRSEAATKAQCVAS